MKVLKKSLTFIFVLLLMCGVFILGVGYMNYRKVIKETPIKEQVSEIRSNENYVTLEEVSPYLIKATVAIEDHRFYEHGGVDYISMLRALVQNVISKGIVGGGSTITQQLAKNMYFDYSANYIRKVSELFVAYDLEKQLSKDEILELYLNIINYGDNHIGILEASQGYFLKNPSKLTLDEASLLAGLPQSPSNYQLSIHLDAARNRQKYVLEAMVEYGYIDKSEVYSLEND